MMVHEGEGRLMVNCFVEIWCFGGRVGIYCMHVVRFFCCLVCWKVNRDL